MKTPRHSHGLSFKKLDLHLHTPASRCFGDRTVIAEQIVDTAIESGLEGIAVTDHNSAAWVDQVKEAAKDKPLTVFPGVEITCQGGRQGLHIIAIFDPSAGKAEVEGLLNELKLQPKDFGKQDALVKGSPETVLGAIDSRGGLAILAHANSTHGAMADMKGKQRIALIRDPCLAAVEATDFQDEKKQKTGKKRIVDHLDGSDESYPKLAVYQASDNPDASGSGTHGLSGIGTRCAYFKLDRINLDGLRQCFNDPDVRIRQDFELQNFTYPRIMKAHVTSGFLEDETPVFHPGLNSILGGKGAGKSLVVEFLRFALDQPSSSDEILEDHQSKLSKRLQEYGKVEVLLSDETGHEFTVARTLRESEDSPFDDETHKDIARLFPVLFLSQNEIIRIAESQAAQIDFIDRFFDFRSYTTSIAQLERDLKNLDKQYAGCLRSLSESAALDKSIKSVDLELNKLNQALKNPVFEEFQKLEKKDHAFDAQSEHLAELIATVTALIDEIRDQSPPEIPEALEKDAAILRVRQTARGAQDTTLATLEEQASALKAALNKITTEHTNWGPTLKAGKQKYEATVQKEGGDYKALAKRRTSLLKSLSATKKRHGKETARADRLKAVAKARNDKLQELSDTYSAYSQERRAKCAKFESESSNRLKLTLHEATDRESFRRRLLALKKGSYLRDSEVDAICTKLDPSEFVKSVINYAVTEDPARLSAIASQSAIEPDRMKTLADFLIGSYEYEALLELQYAAMPSDRPEIEYCIGSGTFEPLEQLSIGQKCAAMLIMALSDGTMPIVIDQPEDSLDIRSVWEDMCKKIRIGKEQRQFIFTTHNASLAVAADSDKFLILEGEATRGRVLFSGSMDHDPVSDEVLKYLEGGPAAYRMKFLKYQGARRLDRRND